MNALTPQQALFVEHYLSHSQGQKAAIAAGYSSNCANRTAFRLLKNPKIQEALKKGQQKTFDVLKIERRDKLKLLWQIATDSQDQGRLSTAIQAIAELNKMQGDYAPVKQNIQQATTRALSEVQVAIEEDVQDGF